VFFAPKYGFGIRRTRLFWVVLSDYIPPTNGNIYLFLVTAIGLDVRICRRLGGIFAHPLLASFIYSERWAFSLFVSFE
jgi:hypothetical protein